MSLPTALAIFIGSLIFLATLSVFLTIELERVGARLGLSEGLMGVVTALGADAPEISSAVFALLMGQNDLGMGVVLGSNVFNLAALLGLSAVISGKVRVGRSDFLVNGGVSLGVLTVTGAMMYGYISPSLNIFLLLLMLGPYFLVISVGKKRIDRIPLVPHFIRKYLIRLSESTPGEKAKASVQKPASWSDVIAILPILAGIIWASRELVSSTVLIGDFWKIPHAITGSLLIAGLTGLPNLIAAVKLASHGRGTAVASEAFNSNALNLVFGITVPCLFVGSRMPSHLTAFTLIWLILLTGFTVLVGSWQRGIGRPAGYTMIGLYVAGASFFLVEIAA